jgi:predicted transcriptional regulator
MQSRILAFIFLFSIFIGAIAFVFLYQARPSGMGHGMGSQLYSWVPIVIVPITFLVVALGYSLLFPEITQKSQEPPKPIEPSTEKIPQIAVEREVPPLDTVLKVLKEDERKVLEAIMNEDGTMLQKDIARTTGFSRVKTHRVLYRLAKRGIVTAERYYNTYKISLADWLSHKGERIS